VSKTKTNLAYSVLEELFVLEGGETPAAEELAVVLRKIEEIMPEVERKGFITGYRSNAIDEIFMDPLAKLIAARICRKFVTDGEIAIYASLEMPAWRKLSELSSEPHRARPTKVSHI
jgi:hypothetical protein